MYGSYSYEEMLRNPGLQIIDWNYINNHPEAKLAIQERYRTDVIFKMRIDELMIRDYAFRLKFEEQFPNSRRR